MSPELLLQLDEAIRAKRKKPQALFDPNFEEQMAFIQDPSRYLAALCTRRAGKSTGLGYRFFSAGQKHPNTLLPYIALTRESAKNIMWPVLQEISDRYGLGANFTESDLSITLLNGARIQLFGADMKNFIRRLRGIKTPFAAVDEAQAFGTHITELVDDVLTPAISDFPDGCLALTGTPGPVPKGLFFEATQGLQGYSVHKWSVLRNPYMPNALAFLEDLKKRKGWDDSHPTYRREWLGEWVTDSEALVYKYSKERNLTHELPAHSIFHYVLGVDLGYDPDPSAFVLCAYTEHDPTLYVIETFKQTKMIISDVAERIRYMIKDLPSCKIVVDAGGQGKQIVEEIRQRYSLPLTAAEKQGKAGFIELLNSDLTLGKIKILERCSRPLFEEWDVLIWDSEAHERKEHGAYPNHLADAFLYAWRYCYNYAFKKLSPLPKPGTEEEIEAFWEKEALKLTQNKEKPFWEQDFY